VTSVEGWLKAELSSRRERGNSLLLYVHEKQVWGVGQLLMYVRRVPKRLNGNRKGGVKTPLLFLPMSRKLLADGALVARLASSCRRHDIEVSQIDAASVVLSR